MVTGTTASSGDHSIITGCAAIAGHVLGDSLARYSVWPGSAKPELVEHVLGDRIGDDRRGARRRSRRRRRGRIEAIAAGALDCVGMAGLGGDRHAERRRPAARSRRPRRRPPASTDRDRHVEAEPLGAPRQEFRIGEHVEGGSSSSARRCQAASVMSGPMPAGSPRVSASGRDIGRAYRYSIIALARSSLRYFLDCCSNRSVNSFSRACACRACCRPPDSFLRAHREHFDALRGHFRRGQLADLGLVEHLRAAAAGRSAELRTTWSRTATSRSARANGMPSSQLWKRARSASASRVRASMQRFGRAARHHEQDRAQRVVVADRVLRLAVPAPSRTSFSRDLEAALEAAADDLAPGDVGLDARL